MPRFSWHRWVRSLSVRQNTPIERKRSARLALEELENRLAPATFVWTGATDGNWSTPTNWQGGVAPTANGFADLVFPNSAFTKATNNDLTSSKLNSITFGGTDYVLAGNQITLGNTSNGTGTV